MSLLNTHLTPGAVEIVTDTLGYDHEGEPLAFVSKAFALPHLGAVITGRGPVVIAYEVSRESIATALGGFDDLVQWMPMIFRRVCEAYRQAFGMAVAGAWGFGEIVAFGYSAERKRMIGVRFVSDGDKVTANRIPDGPAFAPHLDDPSLPNIRDDLRIQKLLRVHEHDLSGFRSPGTFIGAAKIQQILAREIGGQNIGGELIYCKLTKHELTMRKIFRFSDADEMLADMRPAAPALEEGRLAPAPRTAFAPAGDA